ncbi:PC4-domain-containing protein [Lepidopterella palustris CBS 459.81]|uniref:PC4-domain-containing protein n=1 Tax=Lepidopterella palustris CBS 459.81 TaxID=1314670 RepID=A0A8E2DXS8_9PEZI|nr:PC4-domain-containing protein [Lepidopterella palustris CBS 459.81]
MARTKKSAYKAGYKRSADSDDSELEHPIKKTKGSKGEATGPPSLQKDSEGNDYWELSKSKRIAVSEFKGKIFINIREYYEKDGKALPGKKGIMLPPDQFSALISALPQIEKSLMKKGEQVPRPNYEDIGSKSSAEQEVEDDDDEGEADENEDEDDVPRSKKKVAAKIDGDEGDEH